MSVFKLRPSCKDYLWGGHRLVEEYGKEYEGEILAETWELSCHPDGPSTIVNGAYAGKTLEEYIEEAGKEVLGKNCRRFRDFPILIKFIDAKQNLSIQVHPSGDTALRENGEQGKAEMWYIMDCEPQAYLYFGFSKQVSRKEFLQRANDGSICEVLNRVPVARGDVFYILPGTIHAIGGGIVIAEIQQNSNVTFTEDASNVVLTQESGANVIVASGKSVTVSTYSGETSGNVVVLGSGSKIALPADTAGMTFTGSSNATATIGTTAQTVTSEASGVSDIETLDMYLKAGIETVTYTGTEISKDITVQAGTTLTISNDVSLAEGVVFTNNGTLNTSEKTIFTNGGSFVNNGAAVTAKFADMQNPDNQIVITNLAGNFTVAEGCLIIDGTYTTSENGSVIEVRKGTLVISGTLNGELTIKNYGENNNLPVMFKDFVVNPGAVLTLDDNLVYTVESDVAGETGRFLLYGDLVPATNDDGSKKSVTITGLEVEDKVYDGNADADVTGTAALDGVLADDNVTVTHGSAVFVDENAGDNKTVNFSGYSLGGMDAGNYTLSAQPSATASITPKPVTITGVGAANKTYDGTTAADITGTASIDGLVTGDDVYVVEGSAAFASADVGTGITVTFSGFSLSGADTGNYSLSDQPDSVTADITKADYTKAPELNINIVMNQAEAQTGTLTALNFFGGNMPAGATITAVALSGTDNSVIDTISVNGGSLTYTSATNLTTEGTVEAYDVTVSTRNYNDITATLTFTTVAKTPVTISGVSVADKVYDGRAAAYTGTPAAAAANGEAVEVSAYTYTWQSADGTVLSAAPEDAGSYKLVIAVAENDPNYVGSATVSFTISKATVTITVADKEAYVGSDMPELSYTVSGLAASETLATNPTLTCDADMDKAGEYAITASGAAVPATGMA